MTSDLALTGHENSSSNMKLQIMIQEFPLKHMPTVTGWRNVQKAGCLTVFLKETSLIMKGCGVLLHTLIIESIYKISTQLL